MAYYSPRMTRGEPVLGSQALEVPETPPSVANISPSICLSLVQFRELLRQYRSLDDGVTTRMNRLIARSRDTGLTSSPSLLSSHAPSSSSMDIGTSTYSQAPEAVCVSFWKELMNVWTGREQATRYCLAVAERELARKRQEKAGMEPELDAAANSAASSGRSWRGRDTFDDRKSRGEEAEEFTLRQLHNELMVESIIRRRSLDVFKSRCRMFTPTFSPGEEGDRERAMWEGKDTPAANESREQARQL